MNTRRASLLAVLAFFLAPMLQAGEPLSIVNPGFEEGDAGWQASPEDKAENMSQVSKEAAHEGEAGLRVSQAESTATGSWFQTERVPVKPGGAYLLEFWARVNERSGIGVWVQFIDDMKRPIPADGKTDSVQLKPDPAGWTRYQLEFQTPPATAYVTIAVHGYSKHAARADFDDFSLTPVE